LGESSGHRTFAVDDTTTGQKAMLKLWAAAQAQVLAPQVETLGAIKGPHLPATLAHGVDGDDYFLATAFVEGESLEEMLWKGPLSAEQTMTLAGSLLHGLGSLHLAGLLHRDIKPSNIIVHEDGAQLIDFGLTVQSQNSGSIRYLAPEVLGLVRDKPQEHSDLYSVGLVLFECLTGRPARDGASLSEVLKQHTQPLRSIPNLDSALWRWLEKLAHPNIRERYYTVEGASYDLDLIHRGSDCVLGSRDRRDTLCQPAWVGRTPELERLTLLAQSAKPQFALVHGPPGRGKTAFLDELTRRLAPNGPVFNLNARAHPLTDLVLKLRNLQVEVDPLLMSTLVRGEGSEAPPDQPARRRLIGLLLKALAQLKSFTLIFDDYQWSDDLTRELVSEWAVARLDSSTQELLIIGSRDSGLPLCEEFRFDTSLNLEPLTREQSSSLLRSMAGPVTSQVVDLVFQHSDGEPLMVEGVMRGLAESGSLGAEDGLTHLRPDSKERVSVSVQAGLQLGRRLSLLPPDTVHLLEIGALLGRDFESVIVAQVSGLSLEDVTRRLAQARRRNLLWTNEIGHFTFVHDRIREQLEARLTGKQKEALHRDSAQALEAHRPNQRAEIAQHWAATGNFAAAFDCALAAARQAREQLRLQQAAELYKIALQAPDVGPELSKEILTETASVLQIMGRFREAAESLVACLSLITDDRQALALEVQLTRVYYEGADFDKCWPVAQKAFRRLNYEVPSSGIGLGLACAKEMARRRLSRYPRRFDVFEAAQLASLSVQLLQYANLSSKPKLALWSLLIGLNGTENRPNVPDRSILLAHYALLLGIIGFPKEAEKKMPGALELAEAHGLDTFLEVTGMSTFHHLVAGRTEACLRASETVLQQRYGLASYKLVRSTQTHAGINLYFRGDIEGCRRVMRDLHMGTLAKGKPNDIELPCSIKFQVLSGVAVEFPPGPSAEHGMARGFFDTAVGLAALAQNEPTKALNPLEAAAGSSRAIPMAFHTAPVFSWLALAYRRCAEELPGLAAAARQQYLHKAERAATEARKVAAKVPLARPQALRESGVIAALLGDDPQAREYLEQSLSEAQKLHMKLEAAWTRWAMARVGVHAGWPEASGLQKAEERLREFGALVPGLTKPTPESSLSLQDRFSALLHWGRELVAQTTRQGVFSKLVESARELLRAEQILIIDSQLKIVAGAQTMAWSKTLAKESLDSSSVLRAPSSPSESLATLRSSMCLRIPQSEIKPSQQLTLVATHPTMENLFEEEAESTILHLASVAGAALDNARRYQERFQAEIETVALEQRFREAFDHSGLGLVVCDGEGLIRTQNSFFEEMFQETPDHVQDVVFHEDRPLLLEVLKSASQHGVELKCLRPSGELLWTQITSTALPDDEIRLTITDISSSRSDQLAAFERTERRVLATEIHDVISGPLAGLYMHLQFAQRSIESDPVGALATVQNLGTEVTRIESQLQALLTDMRTEIPADQDGLASLRDHLKHMQNLDITAEIPNVQVGGPTGYFLYRLAQEALTNITRHAQASKVSLNITVDPKSVRCEIQDNGIGFNPKPSSWGNGLKGMRRRCRLLGGEFHVTSEVGVGTRYVYVLPGVGGVFGATE
jgi:signal transduction histidine kinase/tetratricopeptide (TPR) repeat protein